MTLTKNDYIVYGGDESTSGAFVLAQILEVQKQAEGPTWFKLKNIAVLPQEEPLDDIVRFDANYFA